MYDTMNHCSKFEGISNENLIGNISLIRNHNIFPGHIFLSKNSDQTQKMKKIMKYINLQTPIY